MQHVYHKIEEDGYLGGLAIDQKIVDELKNHPLYESTLNFIRSLDLEGISYEQLEHIFFQAFFDSRK